MKKLLSLLSVLTISGTAAPTTIAAIYYQKKEKLNNDINYLQTNNLNRRSKREIINSSRKIKFNGLNNEYRGELNIDNINKKIIFIGNNTIINPYYGGLNNSGSLFSEIIIRNLNQDIIKIISIGSKENMKSIINKYNLQNGISYQDGFTIEVNTQEAWRTLFNIGTKNTWEEISSNVKNHPYWQALWKLWIKNNQLIEYDKKIIFQGLSDNYKGEIGLDTTNKKIVFFGNNEQFHSWLQENEPSKIYNKIIIRDQKFNLVKEIIINVGDSMHSVINKYNLQDGIDYKDNNIIEVWSYEPTRTSFFIDGEWKQILNLTEDRKKSKVFIIENNEFKKYEYKLDDNIKNYNLKNINQNNDIVILNELNYLNPNLDISQLEVINITNTSATIKAKNDSDKYFGEKKIYYMINNEQDKIINLYELIKKGLFFKFRDDNINLIFKEIKNINTDNLIYSNVTATKTIEPIYSKNNKSICFGTTTLLNDLSETKIMKSPSCKYTKEKIINTKITTGLSKTNSEEKRTEQKSSLNIENNLNFELGANVQAEAGVWPFKFSAGIDAKAKYVDNYNSLTTNTSLETKSLSNKFNFSSTKIDEYKEISEVEFPSQEITIYPNKKIKIIASLEEVSAQVTLNLKQNIYGEINAKIITLNNEEKTITLSIKEIMQKLKKYNLLPQEITINNDDTITFNGKANRSLKQGFDANIEFHEVK